MATRTQRARGKTSARKQTPPRGHSTRRQSARQSTATKAKAPRTRSKTTQAKNQKQKAPRGRSRRRQSAQQSIALKTFGQLLEILPLGSKAVTSRPAKTVLSRLAGERPSRPKALLTASAAAVSGAIVAYRLLRSGSR